MPDSNETFLLAVQEAHRRTRKHGSRSTRRIKVLHGWVQKEIERRLGAKYEIQGLSDDDDSKEAKVEGWYYPKNVDVLVSRDGKALGVVSFRMVNSNYRQNANNYFENQMGETANLRKNDIVFGNIFCLTDPIPHQKKDGTEVKEEHVRGSDITKYKKLEKDHNYPHAPDVQAFVVVKLDQEQDAIVVICDRQDLEHLDDAEFADLDSMNFDRFFRLFVNGVKNKFDSLNP